VNGKVLPTREARICISDLGLLRGYGVFDFTVTYNREPFRLHDHLERLKRSASIVELGFPWSREELSQLVYETLDKNPGGDKGIRIVVTGGETEDTFTACGPPTLILMVHPVQAYPEKFFRDGIRAITFPARRENPEAKTINYLNGIRALRQARLEGAEEAIYMHSGCLYEGVACNLLAVKDGRLIAPRSGVLDGITRRTVLELVKDDVQVEDRLVHISEVPYLDEAFLCSSGREVMPIVAIDSITIGKGSPGPMTQKIMKLFREYTGKKQ
jgi:branched-chain amino acid aminotransferase